MLLDNCESSGYSGWAFPSTLGRTWMVFKPRRGNAFSRGASVISFISLCNRGPLSNISALQLDPWSFLPSLGSLFTPPLFSPPHLPLQSRMILVDGDFSRGQKRRHRSRGQSRGSFPLAGQTSVMQWGFFFCFFFTAQQFLENETTLQLFMQDSRSVGLKGNASHGSTVTFHYPFEKYHSYENTLSSWNNMAGVFLYFPFPNRDDSWWDLRTHSYSA